MAYNPHAILQFNNDNVSSLLKTSETDLKSKVPSFLSKQVNEIPSPVALFKDYQTTGDNTFKDAAGVAHKNLANYVTKVTSPFASAGQVATSVPGMLDKVDTKARDLFGNEDQVYSRQAAVAQAVPQNIPKKYQDAIFDVGNKTNSNPATLGHFLMKESSGDPKAVKHNTNGTVDQGLMQINSVNLPEVTKYFASQGRKFDPFNPEHSIEAGAYLINKAKNSLQNILGRAPNEAEVYQAYNKGVQGFLKSTQ